MEAGEDFHLRDEEAVGISTWAAEAVEEDALIWEEVVLWVHHLEVVEAP